MLKRPGIRSEVEAADTDAEVTAPAGPLSRKETHGASFREKHNEHHRLDGTVTLLYQLVKLDESVCDRRMSLNEIERATEVAQWRVVAGDDEASAEPVQTVERRGFETGIPLEHGVPYVTAEAHDDNGQVLSTGTPQD